MNSKQRGKNPCLDTDSIASQNLKHATSSNQIRMLTQSEIELLQKNKRESFYKMRELLEKRNYKEKINERFKLSSIK